MSNSLGILGRLGEDFATELDVPSTSLNITDLELMVQWCNSSYQVLSRDEKTDYIWRYLVPEEAVAHPFLMHGILAVSAIHLSRIKDDHRRSIYTNLAVAHQNQALALFRTLLGDINDSNAKAMFAFASVVVLYTFGFPHESEPSDPFASIDDLYQTIVLTRGVQQVINKVSASLRDSSFSHLFQVKDNEHFLQEDARLALEELLEANRSCGAHNELHDTEAYEDTIYKLIDMMGRIQQDLNSMTIAGRWAIRVKAKYVELVRDHDPLALVILSYYCAMLHCLCRLGRHWCLDNWSFRVSKAIWMVLDDQWRPLTRWPMMQVFGQGFLDETFSTT